MVRRWSLLQKIRSQGATGLLSQALATNNLDQVVDVLHLCVEHFPKLAQSSTFVELASPGSHDAPTTCVREAAEVHVVYEDLLFDIHVWAATSPDVRPSQSSSCFRLCLLTRQCVLLAPAAQATEQHKKFALGRFQAFLESPVGRKCLSRGALEQQEARLALAALPLIGTPAAQSVFAYVHVPAWREALVRRTEDFVLAVFPDRQKSAVVDAGAGSEAEGEDGSTAEKHERPSLEGDWASHQIGSDCASLAEGLDDVARHAHSTSPAEGLPSTTRPVEHGNEATLEGPSAAFLAAISKLDHLNAQASQGTNLLPTSMFLRIISASGKVEPPGSS